MESPSNWAHKSKMTRTAPRNYRIMKPMLLLLLLLDGPVLRNYETPEKHQIETMPGGVAHRLRQRRSARPLLRQRRPPALSPQVIPATATGSTAIPADFVAPRATSAVPAMTSAPLPPTIDSDGRIDLFVAGVRSSALHRNLGNGRSPPSL